MNSNRNIWLGVGAIVLIGSFYLIWQGSSHSLLGTNLATAQLAQIPDDYYHAMTISGGVAKNLEGISVSPDGQNVAFVVKQSGKSAVYLNNVAGTFYDSVSLSPFAFSTDSKHYVYSASNGNDSFVVLDGKEQQHYQDGYIDNTSLLISSTGVPAFTVNVSGTTLSQYVVFNGHNGKTYRAVEYLKTSPDGRSVVYYGCNKDNTYNAYADDLTTGTGFCSLVIQDLDGSTHEPGGIFYSSGIFEAIYHGNTTYSPDGKLLAYTTRLGNEDSITINGVNTFSPPGNYSENNISGIVFSPDSKHIAYIAQGCGGANPCIASKLGDLSGGRWFTVLDNNTVGKEYDEIKNLTFNNHDQLAYFARTGDQWSLIVGDNTYPLPANYGKFPSILAFSTDDSHYAYSYTDSSGKTDLIEDGREVAQADSIMFPAFSPRGQLVYVPYNNTDTKMSLTVGGSAQSSHDYVQSFLKLPTGVYGPYYDFTSDGKIIYGAVDGQNISRVVEQL